MVTLDTDTNKWSQSQRHPQLHRHLRSSPTSTSSSTSTYQHRHRLRLRLRHAAIRNIAVVKVSHFSTGISVLRETIDTLILFLRSIPAYTNICHRTAFTKYSTDTNFYMCNDS